MNQLNCPVCNCSQGIQPVFKTNTSGLLSSASQEVPIEKTPYYSCPLCTVWFQSPLPPKKFEAEEEKGEDGRSGGHAQNPQHLAAAANLASAFAHNWIMKRKPYNLRYKTLDIGAKYPYFAHSLKKNFGMDAYGIDGMDFDTEGAAPIVSEYQKELDVPMLMVDFEKVTSAEILQASGGKFDAISMIHVFEHMYEPLKALSQIRELIHTGGYFLIRLPSHEVSGHAQHLSDRHYPIHPFFHSGQSVGYIVETEGSFEVLETYPLPGAGARDFILKAI